MTGAIALAEKILLLLDQGAFTSTYKYAVLLGLLDLVLERTSSTGKPPEALSTRDLAVNVVQRYWSHCSPYSEAAVVLRQNRSAPGSQAEILRKVIDFKQRTDPSAPLTRLRAHPRFRSLVDFVEWKLIEMPLPRLQYVGASYDPFLYEIGWDRSVRRAAVTAHQRGQETEFEGTIRLRPGVAEHLTRLNTMLRPLIQRHWAVDVAAINGLPEARLELFLFGMERVPTGRVRDALQEYQGHRCFYCRAPIRRRDRRGPEVDHFVPWARHPDNGLDNLVVAHQVCNQRKSDFLAATRHLEHWLGRFDDSRFAELTQQVDWDSRAAETRGVAAAIYTGLPEGVQLWVADRSFEVARPADLVGVFGG